MATNRIANVLPYAVFLLAAGGFAAWIISDASKPAGSPPAQVGATEAPRPRAGSMLVPADDLVERLEPGAPRLVVEQRFVNQNPVGVPPVDLSSGSPVLRTRYVVYLARPAARLLPGAKPEDVRPGSYAVTLEFDGAAANHPLLRVEVKPVRR